MTIVVGYVPRDEGRAALRLASDEARLRDARLVVVSLGSVGEPQSSQGAAHHQETVERARRGVREKLAGAEEFLRDAGVPYELHTLVSSEEPGRELVRVAEAEQADFVVIGLRRRSAVGKLVFGSNAQHILVNSPCPVIAVHGDPRR